MRDDGFATLPSHSGLDPVIRWLGHPFTDRHACDAIHVPFELPVVGDVCCRTVPGIYWWGDVGKDE